MKANKQRIKATQVKNRMRTSISVVFAVGALALMVANASSTSGAMSGATAIAATSTFTGANCTLPVRTDRGPGLLAMPNATFTPSGVSATSGRTFDVGTRQWIAAEPQSIDRVHGLTAFVDEAKRGSQTLRLVSQSGRVIYTRNWVRSVVGWVRGSLYITTTDTDKLMRISADAKSVAVLDVPYAGDAWDYASSDSLWGIGASLTKDGKTQLQLVRFDVSSNAASSWYTFRADSQGVTRASVVGIDRDGHPIVADLSATPHMGVYVVSAPTQLTTVYAANQYGDASLRRPLHATTDSHGTWLTTVDGKLFLANASIGLKRITPAGGLRIYAFGAGCN